MNDNNLLDSHQKEQVRYIASEVAKEVAHEMIKAFEERMLPTIENSFGKLADGRIEHKLNNFKNQLGDSLGGINLDDSKDRAKLRDTLVWAGKSREEWQERKSAFWGQVFKMLAQGLIALIVAGAVVYFK